MCCDYQPAYYIRRLFGVLGVGFCTVMQSLQRIGDGSQNVDQASHKRGKESAFVGVGVGTIVGFAAVLWGMGHSEDDDKCPLKQKKRLIYPGGFYIPPPPPSGS